MRCVLLVTLASVGCSGAATPAPPPSIVAYTPAHPDAGPAPAAPLILPHGEPPATWREGMTSAESPLAAPTVTAVGLHHALVRTTNGRQVFAVSDVGGVLGTVYLPVGTTWVGMTTAKKDDRVLAANADGALSFGEVGAAVGNVVFTALTTIPGARVWDAAGPIVAATDGYYVYISTDSGAKFKKSAPISALTAVLARRDGVVVAQGSGRTFVTKDAGKTWRAADYETTEPFVRRGAAIWNGDPVCPVTLSADGKTWTRFDPEEAQLLDWATSLLTSDEIEPSPPAPRETVALPAAPPVPAAADAIVGVDQCDHSGVGSGYGYGMLGVQDCHGVECARGSAGDEAEPGWTEVHFFQDAECATAAADAPLACAPGARLTRWPGLALVDRDAGTAASGRLPPGCEVVRTHNAGGLALMICVGDGGKAHVHTMSHADGAWRDEGPVPAAADDLRVVTMAPDGTLLVPLPCAPGAACRALLRAPEDAGDHYAWREVAVPDAVLYRVSDGGRALAVTRAAGADEYHVALVLDAKDGRRELVKALVLPGDLHDVTIGAGGVSDGNVELIFTGSKTWEVLEDGALRALE